MDTIVSQIEEAFQPLYGIPCWGPVFGNGTFLSLEFGDPSLNIREPRPIAPGDSALQAKMKSRRHVDVRGDWSLMLYMCEWAVHNKGKRIGHSNLRGSSKKPIERAARELEGQAIVKVEYNSKTLKTYFVFDLGSTVTAWPYTNNVDQWWLSSPDGNVFGMNDAGV